MPPRKPKTANELIINRIEDAAKEILAEKEFESINLIIEQDSRGRYPSITIRAKDREIERVVRKETNGRRAA